ncbi:MAG: DPP IV N-terminal domain-containing protein [Bacteroidaceae bacterium]|nr:DPP IV N-terminal domain-containing protein [Bacteroidaceae bacterium]
MKKTLMFALLAAFSLASLAQERLPEYLQAEKFTQEKLNNMLFSTKVNPVWMQKGSKFWYEYKTTKGTNWYIVDAATRTQKALFDLDELAAQLTEIVQDPFDAQHLNIRGLKVKEDARTFTFQVPSTREKASRKGGRKEKETFYFSYDSQTRKLTQLTEEEGKEERGARWGNVSPDKKTVIYAKDLNLYRMSYEDYQKAKKNEKDSTIVEIQLTTDGVKDFGYGQPGNMLNTDTLMNGKRRGVYGITWSPDSRYFAITVEDERAVKDLWVINSVANPRPTLETYKYQMPGEKEAPIEHLYLFDMSNNTRKEIKTAMYKDQTLGIQRTPRKKRDTGVEDLASTWLGDNNRFFLTRSSRDLHRIDVCTYTLGDDSIKTIIPERMNTYQETRSLRLIGNKELIQWSERDGWAHLYLYDTNGKLKNRITKGSYHVEDVVLVDEKSRTVYFKACGMNPKENPYYQHLYKVGLDGGTPKLVTPGDYVHEVQMDDDGLIVVDNYSRVNTVPKTDLLDANGNKIMTLQEADFSLLFAAGYQFPETFTVKAADGITDLYGVMYKPFNMDSTKVYPIVDYVYPGPQVEATEYAFRAPTVRTDRLAQAGFIVVTVGQRGGHPNRSKWYHNYGYGNMRDYPLADHKAAIEQLATRHSFMDINKVGIHGHSGGGFMSTAAILQYPDFFKVAVSCAGNHDNSIYNRWWSETHHGVKEVVTEKGDTTFQYKIGTNQEIASQLKGHLLLVHGDIDNNVHPGNTIRVINALIKAGKRFDMLFLPQQRHSFGDMNEYFYWRLVDYFSEHLRGKSEHFVDIPKR